MFAGSEPILPTGQSSETIVDGHVAVDQRRYPVDRVMQVLSASKIQRAIIFADARSEDLDAQNAYVLQHATERNLYPFYYLGGNPWTDTRPDALNVPDNLEQYAGVRWHRWIGEGIDREGELDRDEVEWAVNLMESPEFEALTAALAHYNRPIIFEESFAVTLEFVMRFPSLDIVVPHLGARSGGETTVIRALWDAPNVYFDTSLARIDETILARVGTDRILFGSGFPYGDPEVELDKIDKLPVADDVKEAIFGENLSSLLSSYDPFA